MNEEFAEAGAPQLGGMGVSMVGPTIIVHGTEEQKAEHLPRDPHGRVALVPGLQRARLRLRPRIAADRAPCATATTTSSTARRSGPPAPSTPTGCSCSPAPTRTRRSTAASASSSSTLSTPGITRAAAGPDERRRPASTRCSSTTCASRRRTSSARRTAAGTSARRRWTSSAPASAAPSASRKHVDDADRLGPRARQRPGLHGPPATRWCATSWWTATSRPTCAACSPTASIHMQNTRPDPQPRGFDGQAVHARSSASASPARRCRWPACTARSGTATSQCAPLAGAVRPRLRQLGRSDDRRRHQRRSSATSSPSAAWACRGTNGLS